MNTKYKDLTGRKFGRLTAIEVTDERKESFRIWKCVCECGNISYIRSNTLLMGHTQSCGCAQKDAARRNGRSCRKPGDYTERHGRYYRCMLQAERRGKQFSLSEKEFFRMITEPCFYCGELDGYNGVDRVDNSIGYTDSNCVPCCKNCNSMKNGVTVDMARKILAFVERKESV